MDAGLAAVLGATVGALGTGATGLAAALLSRNTARHQVKAESMRALRDSRRATYLAFAERHERYLDLLSTTLTPLGRVERFPDQREEWIEKAHKRWDQALKYRQNEVQKIRVVLSLDATRPVADAALEVTEKCTLLSGATRHAIEALKGQALDTGPITPPLPGYIELLAEAGLDPAAPDLHVLQGRAQDAYKAFLRTAADAVGENGLLPSG
ncbi:MULTISPECIES: hypothetical protein [unclassified Streptomyces]|uniref:hypothetical protein n=1 Tax=unclassified Streptomyces TaxID=2593676 RepID=UPI001BEAA906|nr:MULTISPECIES: hypothetical protein [unclassified Streptomyces]MBT2404578.1 hypothetical protein [Streptomyces sp. ISL-21]MBT2610460.1 hypothetical protein [Streptomyces sp. ISL-87]